MNHSVPSIQAIHTSSSDIFYTKPITPQLLTLERWPAIIPTDPHRPFHIIRRTHVGPNGTPDLVHMALLPLPLPPPLPPHLPLHLSACASACARALPLSLLRDE